MEEQRIPGSRQRNISFPASIANASIDPTIQFPTYTSLPTNTTDAADAVVEPGFVDFKDVVPGQEYVTTVRLKNKLSKPQRFRPVLPEFASTLHSINGQTAGSQNRLQPRTPFQVKYTQMATPIAPGMVAPIEISFLISKNMIERYARHPNLSPINVRSNTYSDVIVLKSEYGGEVRIPIRATLRGATIVPSTSHLEFGSITSGRKVTRTLVFSNTCLHEKGLVNITLKKSHAELPIMVTPSRFEVPCATPVLGSSGSIPQSPKDSSARSVTDSNSVQPPTTTSRRRSVASIYSQGSFGDGHREKQQVEPGTVSVQIEIDARSLDTGPYRALLVAEWINESSPLFMTSDPFSVPVPKSDPQDSDNHQYSPNDGSDSDSIENLSDSGFDSSFEVKKQKTSNKVVTNTSLLPRTDGQVIVDITAEVIHHTVVLVLKDRDGGKYTGNAGATTTNQGVPLGREKMGGTLHVDVLEKNDQLEDLFSFGAEMHTPPPHPSSIPANSSISSSPTSLYQQEMKDIAAMISERGIVGSNLDLGTLYYGQKNVVNAELVNNGPDPVSFTLFTGSAASTLLNETMNMSQGPRIRRSSIQSVGSSAQFEQDEVLLGSTPVFSGRNGSAYTDPSRDDYYQKNGDKSDSSKALGRRRSSLSTPPSSRGTHPSRRNSILSQDNRQSSHRRNSLVSLDSVRISGHGVGLSEHMRMDSRGNILDRDETKDAGRIRRSSILPRSSSASSLQRDVSPNEDDVKKHTRKNFEAILSEIADRDFHVLPSQGEIPPFGRIPITIIYNAIDRFPPPAFRAGTALSNAIEPLELLTATGLDGAFPGDNQAPATPNHESLAHGRGTITSTAIVPSGKAPTSQSNRHGCISKLTPKQQHGNKGMAKSLDTLFAPLVYRVPSIDYTHKTILSVRAVRPSLTVSLSHLDYGTVAQQTKSHAVFSIENSTELLPIRWSIDAATGFFAEPESGVLAAGESVDVMVSFIPRRIGPIHDVLVISAYPHNGAPLDSSADMRMDSDSVEVPPPGTHESKLYQASMRENVFLTMPIAVTANVQPPAVMLKEARDELEIEERMDTLGIGKGTFRDRNLTKSVYTFLDTYHGSSVHTAMQNEDQAPSMQTMQLMQTAPKKNRRCANMAVEELIVPSKEIDQFNQRHTACTATRVRGGSTIYTGATTAIDILKERATIDHRPNTSKQDEKDFTGATGLPYTKENTTQVEANAKKILDITNSYPGLQSIDQPLTLADESIQQVAQHTRTMLKPGVTSSTAVLKSMAQKGYTLEDIPGESIAKNTYTYSVQGLLAKQQHNAEYNQYITTSRAIRENEKWKAEATKRGTIVTPDDPVSLGIGDGKADLPQPRMSVPDMSNEPLWLVQTNTSRGITKFRKDAIPQILRVDKLFKEKHKSHPLTHVEVKDCQTILTDLQLESVITSPMSMDFGVVTVRAPKAMSLGVVNGLSSSILVEIEVPPNVIELSECLPLSQVFPPGARGGFDIIFHGKSASMNSPPIRAICSLIINKQHIRQFAVSAVPRPICVELSTTSIRMSFRHGDVRKSTTENVSIYNPTDAVAVYRWQMREINGNSISSLARAAQFPFDVEPSSGKIQPYETITSTFTFTPFFKCKLSMQFELVVEGGPSEGGPIMLVTAEEIEPLVALSEKILDFGTFGAGLKKTLSVRMKNKSKSIAVYYVNQGLLPEGVEVEPASAQIEEGEWIDIHVSIDATGPGILDANVHYVSFQIRGGREIRLPLMAHIISPNVEIAEAEFDFGKVVVGGTGRRRLTIMNHSPIYTEVTFDMAAIRDNFTLYPAKSTSHLPNSSNDADSPTSQKSTLSRVSQELGRSDTRDGDSLAELSLFQFGDAQYDDNMDKLLDNMETFPDDGEDDMQWDFNKQLEHNIDNNLDNESVASSSRHFGPLVPSSMNRAQERFDKAATNFLTGNKDITNVDSPAVEQQDTDGFLRVLPEKFRIRVAPNEQASFDLVFRPTVASSFEFKLPVGLSSQLKQVPGLDRTVKAESIQPLIQINRTNIDFGYSCIQPDVSKDKSVPVTQTLKVFNIKRDKEVYWRVGSCLLSPHTTVSSERSSRPNSRSSTPGKSPQQTQSVKTKKVKNPFSIQPTYGILPPNGCVTLTVTFAPEDPVRYSLYVPLIFQDFPFKSDIATIAGGKPPSDELVIERNVSPFVTTAHQSSVELEVTGHGIYPQICFDRRELILPPVPLGAASLARFWIFNIGFDYLQLKWRLPASEITSDTNIPITVGFPGGDILSHAKHSIPVDIEFRSNVPTAFTAYIEIYDSFGKLYSLPITAVTDASLLTTSNYLEAHREHLFVKTSITSPPLLVGVERVTPESLAHELVTQSTYAPNLVSAQHPSQPQSRRRSSIVSQASSVATYKDTCALPALFAPDSDNYTAIGSTGGIGLGPPITVAHVHGNKVRMKAVKIAHTTQFSFVPEVADPSKPYVHPAPLPYRNLEQLRQDYQHVIKFANTCLFTTPIPMDQWPQAITEEFGRPVFNMVETLTGIPIPGRFQGSLPVTKRERSALLYDQASRFLTYLKLCGAYVHGVRPETLLPLPDFLLCRKYLPEGLFGFAPRHSTGHGDDRIVSQKMIPNESHERGELLRKRRDVQAYPVLSFISWVTVIQQCIRVFLVNTITLETLINTPAMEMDTASNMIWEALVATKKDVEGRIESYLNRQPTHLQDKERKRLGTFDNRSVRTRASTRGLSPYSLSGFNSPLVGDAFQGIHSPSSPIGKEAFPTNSPQYSPSSPSSNFGDQVEQSVAFYSTTTGYTATSRRGKTEGVQAKISTKNVPGSDAAFPVTVLELANNDGNEPKKSGRRGDAASKTVWAFAQQAMQGGNDIRKSGRIYDPGLLLEKESLEKAMNDFTAPDATAKDSNVFSSGELLLLRWVSWHVNRMMNIVAIPSYATHFADGEDGKPARGNLNKSPKECGQETVLKKQSKGVFLLPRKFAEFQSDMADLSTFILLILSHAPELGMPGGILDVQGNKCHLGPHPLSLRQIRENAEAVVGALRALGLEPPFSVDDLCPYLVSPFAHDESSLLQLTTKGTTLQNTWISSTNSNAEVYGQNHDSDPLSSLPIRLHAVLQNGRQNVSTNAPRSASITAPDTLQISRGNNQQKRLPLAPGIPITPQSGYPPYRTFLPPMNRKRVRPQDINASSLVRTNIAIQPTRPLFESGGVVSRSIPGSAFVMQLLPPIRSVMEIDALPKPTTKKPTNENAKYVPHSDADDVAALDTPKHKAEKEMVYAATSPPLPRDWLLWTLYLFFTLPQVVPRKPVVVFSGALQSTIQKSLVLQNPSSKPITYDISLHGSPDTWSCKQSVVKVNPNSIQKVPIYVSPMFSYPEEAKITFVARRIGACAPGSKGALFPSILTFALKTRITARPPIQASVVESVCFQPAVLTVDVENPSKRSTTFLITLIPMDMDAEEGDNISKSRNANRFPTLQDNEALSAAQAMIIAQQEREKASSEQDNEEELSEYVVRGSGLPVEFGGTQIASPYYLHPNYTLRKHDWYVDQHQSGSSFPSLSDVPFVNVPSEPTTRPSSNATASASSRAESYLPTTSVNGEGSSNIIPRSHPSKQSGSDGRTDSAHSHPSGRYIENVFFEQNGGNMPPTFRGAPVRNSSRYTGLSVQQPRETSASSKFSAVSAATDFSLDENSSHILQMFGLLPRGAPPTFHCKYKQVTIRGGSKKRIPIHFLPFHVGVSKVAVVMVDKSASVAELVYEVTGSSLLPPPLPPPLSIHAHMTKHVKLWLRVPPLNISAEKAMDLVFERYPPIERAQEVRKRTDERKMECSLRTKALQGLQSAGPGLLQRASVIGPAAFRSHQMVKSAAARILGQFYDVSVDNPHFQVPPRVFVPYTHYPTPVHNIDAYITEKLKEEQEQAAFQKRIDAVSKEQTVCDAQSADGTGALNVNAHHPLSKPTLESLFAPFLMEELEGFSKEYATSSRLSVLPLDEQMRLKKLRNRDLATKELRDVLSTHVPTAKSGAQLRASSTQLAQTGELNGLHIDTELYPFMNATNVCNAIISDNTGDILEFLRHFPITLSPSGTGVYTAKITLVATPDAALDLGSRIDTSRTFGGDIRTYQIKVHVSEKSPVPTISFSTPVSVPISQLLPITNPSDIPWNLDVVIEKSATKLTDLFDEVFAPPRSNAIIPLNHSFISPRALSIPPKSTVELPLLWTPPNPREELVRLTLTPDGNTLDSYHEASARGATFSSPMERRTRAQLPPPFPLVYHLHGESNTIAPVTPLEISCEYKKPVQCVLYVKNTFADRAIRFEVKTDARGFTGQPSILVHAAKPYKEGEAVSLPWEQKKIAPESCDSRSSRRSSRSKSPSSSRKPEATAVPPDFHFIPNFPTSIESYSSGNPPMPAHVDMSQASTNSPQLSSRGSTSSSSPPSAAMDNPSSIHPLVAVCLSTGNTVIPSYTEYSFTIVATAPGTFRYSLVFVPTDQIPIAKSTPISSRDTFNPYSPSDPSTSEPLQPIPVLPQAYPLRVQCASKETLESIPLTCVVGQELQYDLAVSIPDMKSKTTPLLVDVTIEGEFLSAPSSMTLLPGTDKYTLPVTFAPLRPTFGIPITAICNISHPNTEIMDIVYAFSLNALPPAPVTLPSMSTPLGQSSTTWITIPNNSDTAMELSVISVTKRTPIGKPGDSPSNRPTGGSAKSGPSVELVPSMDSVGSSVPSQSADQAELDLEEPSKSFHVDLLQAVECGNPSAHKHMRYDGHKRVPFAIQRNGAVLVPPISSVRVPVIYTPFVFNEPEGAYIRLQSNVNGEVHYIVEGKGVLPPPFHTQSVSIPLGSQKPFHCIFKNPFNHPLTILATLEGQDGVIANTGSASSVVSSTMDTQRRSGQYPFLLNSPALVQVPGQSSYPFVVTFHPTNMGKFQAKLVLSPADPTFGVNPNRVSAGKFSSTRISQSDRLHWTFPLVATADIIVSSSPIQLTTEVGTQLEISSAFPLLSLPANYISTTGGSYSFPSLEFKAEIVVNEDDETLPPSSLVKSPALSETVSSRFPGNKAVTDQNPSARPSSKLSFSRKVFSSVTIGHSTHVDPARLPSLLQEFKLNPQITKAPPFITIPICFHPLRSISGTAELVVTATTTSRKSGKQTVGIWRRPVRISVPPPKVLSILSIYAPTGQVGKLYIRFVNPSIRASPFGAFLSLSSSPRLVISPGSGVFPASTNITPGTQGPAVARETFWEVITEQQANEYRNRLRKPTGATSHGTNEDTDIICVTYSPLVYGERVEGTLEVNTAECQWIFKIIGKPPKD